VTTKECASKKGWIRKTFVLWAFSAFLLNVFISFLSSVFAAEKYLYIEDKEPILCADVRNGKCFPCSGETPIPIGNGTVNNTDKKCAALLPTSPPSRPDSRESRNKPEKTGKNVRGNPEATPLP